MEDIILIADPKIRSMPILDNGEPLIEVTQSSKKVKKLCIVRFNRRINFL